MRTGFDGENAGISESVGFRTRLNQKISSRQAATVNLQKAESGVEAHREALRLSDAANAVFVETAKKVQQTLHQRLSQLVSECLSAVFDDPYEFVIEFETKRNNTEARVRFRRNGQEIDPYSAGGGVIDVASLALRLSSLMIEDPNNRRLLVMDEPFRCASKSIRDRIGAMLTVLADKFGCQLIIVTHMEEIITSGSSVVDLRNL